MFRGAINITAVSELSSLCSPGTHDLVSAGEVSVFRFVSLCVGLGPAALSCCRNHPREGCESAGAPVGNHKTVKINYRWDKIGKSVGNCEGTRMLS